MNGRRLRVAVLISGYGSNLQALLDACAEPDFPAEVVLVISNVPGAYGLQRAAAAGVAARTIDHRKFPGREAFEAALSDALAGAEVELICMAGFLRIVSPSFVERWRDRVLNIHPSLLPAFRGLHAHAQALAAGVKVHGCTVHFVRAELDDGPIVGQAAVPVLPDDDAERLAARVLAMEHRLYPRCLRLVAAQRIAIAGTVAILSEGAADAADRLSNPTI